MTLTENTAKFKFTLILITLGVAFGDIGTSPMYALPATFALAGLDVTTNNIYGITSLIIWLLFIIVSFKYLLFVFRANNKGEGGILVLTNLIIPYLKQKRAFIVLILGLTGTALFLGDAIISPSMSILSAVEGLKVISPKFADYIVIIAITIVISLFIIQSFGTNKIGKLFGYVMLLWFITLAGIGLYQIFLNYHVLSALNPCYAINFIRYNGWYAFFSMGGIALALTGAESLYADIGHCGVNNIRKAWWFLAFPCLILNYVGQGALLLNTPEAILNPFFMSVPTFLIIPLVLLATFASVIASQAVISGTFSLVRQLIQLGYLPRCNVSFTSTDNQGNIYINRANYMLMFAVIITIILFQSSLNLSAAYGLATTGIMLVTSLLFYLFAITKLRWHKSVALLISICFVIIDVILFSSSLIKLISGGWLPVCIAFFTLTSIYIWRKGRKILQQKNPSNDTSFSGFMEKIVEYPPHIVKERTAIFLTADLKIIPKALLQNIVHNRVLHNKNLLMLIKTTENPFVSHDERIKTQQINQYFYKVVVNCGFKETPDMNYICNLLQQHEVIDNVQDVSFFISNFNILVNKQDKPLYYWLMLKYFSLMYNTSSNAANYFKIMPNKVIELSTRIDL